MHSRAGLHTACLPLYPLACLHAACLPSCIGLPAPACLPSILPHAERLRAFHYLQPCAESVLTSSITPAKPAYGVGYVLRTT